LEGFGFAAKVRALCCEPAYNKSGVGRPGIDPVVYLKMIMVGFFEDLPSERAIAARCADSIAIRGFLNYELNESTPDHSSLSIIRQRLGLESYQQIFNLCLQALQEHGLLRGKNLGIDSSVIEANASLRALVHRNTEEQYWDYVKRLAAEQGIDPEDAAAVRKFDRNRPGKGSNQEWENPHDPDAKIGPKKDGATDMIYKPEAVVDLDTGAIDFNRWNSSRGPVIPACVGQLALDPRARCSTGPIEVQLSAGNARYRGLLLKLDRRWSRRFQFTAAYALASSVGLNRIINNDSWFESYGPTASDRQH
jgi:transposase